MQHKKIRELQIQGYGYKKISKLLGLSENTVKSYVKRNPISKSDNFCMNCGVKVTNTPHKKRKKFCSDECRLNWWNSHPEEINRKAIYKAICIFCGKEFESYGNNKRKYCSRTCFANARSKETM